MEDAEYLKKLGERIVMLRKQKGLTQIELAARLDMKNTHLRRIEKGEVNSSINALRRLARALEVRIQDLIVEE